MLHKTSPFEFKSLDDAGTFEATVAVFGNVDKGGDRILPGAFKNTLEAWKASGDPIPVIFNHDWGTPDAHIGVVDEAVESEKGLYVKGRLDIADNPVAKQVHRLMQRRSLKEFSFGYSIPQGGQKRAKDGANELSHIDLAEVGPTLKGMNPATELHAVKSAVEAATAEVVDEDTEKSREDLIKELEEVRAQLAAVLEEKKDTGETEKTHRSHSDPLRKQALALAREVAMGAVDSHQAPIQEQPKAPIAPPADEIRREARELMLQVLTGRNER